MPRIRMLAAVLVLAAFSGGWLLGDDIKKVAETPKADPPKATHKLPTGWKELGLSDTQKKKIYAIEDEYGPKIAALKKQLEDLEKEQRGKRYEVLTEDQKKHLREIREAQDSGGKPKDDKKDEKKDDKKDEKKP